MSALLTDATKRQIKAARPKRSTWLSANAGSGKTRVLTDRVARLLLDGTDPQNILCLTYTKAAASEMQNRLFKRLGAWAMKDDAALSEELAELGVAPTQDADFLGHARRLFAQAVETPGGLRIQTIHSFCAALLRRFPREAMVSPMFQEIDDRSATLLRESVADELASSEDARAFREIIHLIGGSDFHKFLSALSKDKALFEKKFGFDEACRLFGLPDGVSESTPALKVAELASEDLAEAMLTLRGSVTKSYQTFIDSFAQASQDKAGGYDAFCKLCLYASENKDSGVSKWDSKSRNFPQSKHKSAVEAFAPVMDELHSFMDQVSEAKHLERHISAARATERLHRFAQAFITRYETAKEARGWLDFDDLILKTRALLRDPDVASWVLYRLDGGIDHILVDEAQDTSPTQWDVIELLSQEITAGQGAVDDKVRTLFVVGDKKQSIYSFQGADATEFERMRRHFAEKFADHPEPLVESELITSFRSAEAVLGLVDSVFEGQQNEGVDNTQHIAFHTDMPGRVDIWEPEPKIDAPEEKQWFDPVDIVDPSDPMRKLAERIAAQIKSIIEAKTLIPTKRIDGTWQARPIHEGDFLILLQRRQKLFHEIIRACKSAKLDIAGADRLQINKELAVKDLVALLSFLETPEDDLSLATALRSPLFGWTEQELFTLAAHRGSKYLWTALREAQEQHPQTLNILNDLRSQAEFLRPYELIDRMLTRHGGRKKLLERLGHEAEDGIDAFLSQALTYERSSVPSLTGFLSWLASDDPEAKRQAESAGRRIRVMTVHGAKGLEAPVVILPETQNRKDLPSGSVLQAQGVALYNVSKEDRPPLLEKAEEQRAESQIQERQRLLYVAMTRAEKWLIVAAAGDVDNDASWYSQISEAAQRHAPDVLQSHGESVRRIETGDWSAFAESEVHQAAQETALSDPCFARPSAQKPRPEQPLAVTSLPGAKAMGSDRNKDRDEAMAYGTLVHNLLEHLPEHPPESWPKLAASFAEPLGLEAFAVKALNEARTVIAEPTFAKFFSEQALSEVPVTLWCAPLQRRLHGTIDKLIVGSSEVQLIDFKTNETVPDTPKSCPEGILRQMGAYAKALGEIYPDKVIKPSILWTSNAELMRLPHDLVIGAYLNTTYLDDPLAET